MFVRQEKYGHADVRIRSLLPAVVLFIVSSSLLSAQGVASREARLAEIEHAMLDTSFFSLISKYVADYPEPAEVGIDKRVREIYVIVNIRTLIAHNNAAEAIRIYEALPDKPDEYLINITMGLAWQGVETQRMFGYADSLLTRSRDTAWERNSTRYVDRGALRFYTRRAEVTGLNCIGKGLTTLGRHTEALAAYREAFDKSDSSDTWLNENLLRSYLANGYWDEALDFGVACIRNEVAGDSIAPLLRAEIRKRNGSEEAFDALLKATIEDAAKKTDEALERGRLNLPLKPCGLTTLDGEPVDLKSHAGKVVILDFWATWCGPCKTAMPLFQKFYESARNDPRIAVMSVNVWEQGTRNARIERVRKFIAELKYSFPVLLGDDCNETFKLKGVPTMVIIDRKGTIQYSEVGEPLAGPALERLNRMIALLLKDQD